MPEYLILAFATAGLSLVAKQLGEFLQRIRERQHRRKPADEGSENRDAPPKQQKVELLLHQPDGSFHVAAKGQVDQDVVHEIIDEIGPE